MTVDFGMKFERLLGTFVPGALLILGTWYFHRPLLLQRFPNISAEDVGADTKAIVFLVLAVGAGVVIQHMADTAVAVLIRDAAASNKAHRRMRRWSRKIARLLSFTASEDPRVLSIKRYLDSPRKAEFMRMMQDWAGTSSHLLGADSEKVIAHQHIVVELKTHSEQSRSVVDEIYYEVHFAAALFSAVALLLPISILALWTSRIANEEFASFSTLTYGVLIFIVWSFGAVTAYSVKRQFRDFCSQVLTLALHFHMKEAVQPSRSGVALAAERLLGPDAKLAG